METVSGLLATLLIQVLLKQQGKKLLYKSLHKLQFKEITQIWQRQDVCTFKKWFSVLVVTAVSDDPNCRLLLT